MGDTSVVVWSDPKPHPNGLRHKPSIRHGAMFREIGARKRTRTSTPLRELRPERSASANSAIRALLMRTQPHQIDAAPEMLTPAQPRPRMHRSIFILPGSSRFVNATTALGSGPASGFRGLIWRQQDIRARRQQFG